MTSHSLLPTPGTVTDVFKPGAGARGLTIDPGDTVVVRFAGRVGPPGAADHAPPGEVKPKMPGRPPRALPDRADRGARRASPATCWPCG